MESSTKERKKSPRAPSLPLGEAIERAHRMYKADRLNAAPVDVAAQHIGYKNAKSGAALQTLASLGYYGVVERPREGMLVVSKDLELYLHAPDENKKREILFSWLRRPPIFEELLGKYAFELPSIGVLRYDLIERGFTASAANHCASVFVESVNMSEYYRYKTHRITEIEENSIPSKDDNDTLIANETVSTESKNAGTNTPNSGNKAEPAVIEEEEVDRIPIRLSQNRRAWLIVPARFYSADKERLKAQIDLLLANDEE